MSSVLRNYRKIYTTPGADPSMPGRVYNLETNEYKVTYYQVVTGTSGTLTVPSGGTINSNEFGLSGNAILSKIDVNSKPTYESPVTSGGSQVTASLNVLTGAWVASGVYTDASVALIYSVKIKGIDYHNLVYNNIVETVKVTADVSTINLQTVTDGGSVTTHIIETTGYVKTGGTSSQFLKADGSVDSSVYITSSALTPYLTTTLAALTYFPIPTGTTSQYLRGDGSLATFPTIPSGTVTSVDLTMPSAFTVSGNPVTNSGTLAVTGAGVVSQYIRGDGTLANFPTSTGGGSSVSYYLNGSVAQGTIGGIDFKEVNKTPVIGAGTDFTINANGYIQSFITDANDPNQLVIPGGNWNFETYFSASSGGGSPSFYVELYKWDGTTLTLIASNSATPEYITNGMAIDLYITALAVPQTTLTLTDRLAIRIYVTHSSKTITLHTEDNHLCQIITTFSTGLTALNGLTAQVQSFGNDTNVTMVSSGSTHTLTWAGTLADSRIASASTWNAKQNALSGTGFVKSTAGVISYDTNTYLTTANAASTYYPLTNPAGYITASSLTGYVPYTGATANLNLGTFTLTTPTINGVSGNLAFANAVQTTGAITAFTFTKPNNTNQTLSTSIAGFNYNGGSRQWATGAITTQSENVWGATTYSFVGASTITNAYGNVFNAPVAGTNATITNNYSAQFNGKVEANLGLETNTLAGLNTASANLLIVSNNTATKGYISIGNNSAETVYIQSQLFGFSSTVFNTPLNATGFSISRVTPSDTIPNFVMNRSDLATGIGGVLNKISLIANGLTRFSVNGVTTSGATTSFSLTKPDNTNQTLSTSIAGFNYNGGTRQWATGAITTQTENVWGATTYSFVGASTITNAYGNVFNAPIAGTNTTITNNWAGLFNGNVQVVGNLEPSASFTYGLGHWSKIWNTCHVNNLSIYNLAAIDPTNGLQFRTTTNSTQMKMFNSGNFTLQNAGTFTDNGFRLEVVGTGRFTDTLTVTNKLIAGFNTTPRTGIVSDGVTSVLGNLQNFTTNYHSGEVLYSEVSGEALNFGQLCYRNAAGKWQKATGSSVAIAAYNMLGICLQTVGATDTAISILTRGYVESTYLSAGAVGNPLFMDATTAGSITNTAPSTAGNVVRVIGNVFWSSALQTNAKWIVYFNPDNTWIEL